MRLKRIIDTTAKVRIKLSGEDIIALLKAGGNIPRRAQCEAAFEVPGGGDWSHMSIEIDEDNAVTVSYEVTTTTEDNK